MPFDPATDVTLALELAKALVSVFEGNSDPQQIQKAIDAGNEFLAKKAQKPPVDDGA
jgi:hypothetical protein